MSDESRQFAFRRPPHASRSASSHRPEPTRHNEQERSTIRPCVCAAEAWRPRQSKTDPGPERLYIIRRNLKEEAHARRRIACHLKKIEKILDSGSEKKINDLLRHKTFKRYVKRDGRSKDEKERAAGPVLLDREAIEAERQLAGKSVIGTDVCDADPLTEDELYRSLFAVERCFRTLKTALEIGPVRHRRDDRIKAHTMIGVLAYNLAAWLERKSGLAAPG